MLLDKPKRRISKKTFIHCCASHFLKNADAMHWIGLLLQSSNLREIDDIVESLTIVTHSQLSTDLVKKHYHKLKGKIERVEYDEFQVHLFDEEDIEDKNPK